MCARGWLASSSKLRRMLVLALLAAAPQWSVTLTTSRGVDHGDGVTRGVEGSKSVIASTDPDVKRREQVAALLPDLPVAPATYSMSDFVDDEGWYRETLTLERVGKRVVFELVQGKRAPPMPKALAELRSLLRPALK